MAFGNININIATIVLKTIEILGLTRYLYKKPKSFEKLSCNDLRPEEALKKSRITKQIISIKISVYDCKL